MILETYPELKDRLSGSLKMLDKLFQDYNELTEADDTEVFALARKLKPLVAKLSDGTMTITNREIVDRLFGCMTSDFKRAVRASLDSMRQLKNKLDIQGNQIEALEKQGAAAPAAPAATYVPPAKQRNDDPYEWEEVLGEMLDIVRHRPVPSTWVASKSKQESGSSTRVKIKDLQSQVSGFGAQLLNHIKLQNAREDTHRKELKTWQEDVNRIQQQMLANLSNSGTGREISSNTGNQYASRNNTFLAI